MMWMTPASVAKELGITPCRVRQLADAGRIPVVRTVEGNRLFDLRDVQRLASQRQAAAEVAADGRDGKRS